MNKETFRGFYASKKIYVFRYKKAYVLNLVYTVNTKKSIYKTKRKKNS